MRKNVKWLVLVLVSMMVLGMFLGCGGNRAQFVGTWIGVDENGNQTEEKLVLAKNGEGSITDSGLVGSVKWSVDGNRLFLTVSMCGMTNSQEFTYEFAGNRMILTAVDDGDVSIYVRQ